MIDHTFDFDENFFREVTIALARTLNKNIRWINRFDDSYIRVLLPFYTSLTGDERFLMDAFIDDVVDQRISTNTDQYQRGVITFNGFSSVSDEFANPNQYLAQKANINGKERRILSKVKAVPVNFSYDIEIKLATESEVSKCSQKILELLYNYFFFSFDYYGLKMDAILILPDDKTIEIVREITMESDNKKTIKFSLEVRTYFPIFQISIDDLIACDNDGEINWDYLGVPKPTNNFMLSLLGYKQAYGDTAPSGVSYTGSTEGDFEYDPEDPPWPEIGAAEPKKVYWSAYFHELSKFQDVILDKKIRFDPRTWGKEDNL